MSHFIVAVIEPELIAAIRDWQRGDYASCFVVMARYASADQAEAQAILGIAYLIGYPNLAKDRSSAVHWLERATANGHPTAPLHLALLFDPTNELVERENASADMASKYYKIAFDRCKAGAESGNADLMAALASCYASGLGTVVDESLVKYWAGKALAAGYKGQL